MNREATQGAASGAAQASGSSRREPHLDPAHEGLRADPGYQHLHRDPAFARDTEKPRGLSRWLLGSAIFAVGAAAGAAVAWWMHEPVSPVKPVSVITRPHMPAPASEPSARDGAGKLPVIRGISRSELPYDGNPPPAEAGARPASGSSGGGMQASSAAGGETASDAGIEKPLAQKTHGRSEAPESEKPLASDRNKSEAKEDSGTSKVAEAPPKRKAAPKPKTAKDLEIERIRRQVDEELKGKQDRSPGTASLKNGGGQQKYRRASVSGKTTSVRVALAKCAQASSFISREHCKWKICNGMWGKNGCPYYPPPPKNY